MWKNLTKLFYSIFRRPYLNLTFRYTFGGTLAVNAVFNDRAILEIDNRYANFGRRDYDPRMPNNDKIAMFVAEMFADLAPAPATPEQPEDERVLPDVIPYLKDAPVKATVDVAKIAPRDRML